MRSHFTMRYFTLTLLLICSLSSCVIVNTPGFYSGYKDLSDTEKEQVVFTQPTEDICDKTNDKKIYAINGKQLLNCMKSNDTSVVYLWSPHCSSDACITMQVAQRYCDKMNYKLYIVAEYYDMDMMGKQHTTPGPLFIANHKHYKANYCGKYVKRFTNDLLNGKTLNKDEKYSRFLFFKGDELVSGRHRLIPIVK